MWNIYIFLQWQCSMRSSIVTITWHIWIIYKLMNGMQGIFFIMLLLDGRCWSQTRNSFELSACLMWTVFNSWQWRKFRGLAWGKCSQHWIELANIYHRGVNWHTIKSLLENACMHMHCGGSDHRKSLHFLWFNMIPSKIWGPTQAPVKSCKVRKCCAQRSQGPIQRIIVLYLQQHPPLSQSLETLNVYCLGTGGQGGAAQVSPSPK